MWPLQGLYSLWSSIMAHTGAMHPLCQYTTQPMGQYSHGGLAEADDMNIYGDCGEGPAVIGALQTHDMET